MKLLYICQSYPPMISGAALAVARLAQGAAQNGHDVLVIAASDREEGYSERKGQVRIERLPARHNPKRVGQRFLLWPRRRLRALVEAHRPDLVHLHEPLLLGLCTLQVIRRRRLPVVLTIHQLPWFITKYAPTVNGRPVNVERLVWIYGRWFLNRCDAAIVPAGPIAAIVRQNTGNTPQTIAYGIDMHRFTPKTGGATEGEPLRRKYGLRADKPVILHVGRLDADKDVTLVVEAAARTMQTTDADLLIVGDGCEKEALLGRCEALGIRSRSHFTGYLDQHGDLPGLYRLASLFVTASKIETFGIVLLEAMAAGCPVVAVRAGAVPNLVTDGCHGILVDPDNVAALAQKMTWLLRHPNIARAMGQQGRWKSGQYDTEMMVDRHLRLYRSFCHHGETYRPQSRTTKRGKRLARILWG